MKTPTLFAISGLPTFLFAASAAAHDPDKMKYLSPAKKETSTPISCAELNPDELTPKQALEALYRLKQLS